MEKIVENNEWKASLVKRLRESAGWSQSILAEQAGVAERTIQRLEKDGTASSETWIGVANAFQMKVTDFDVPPISEAEIRKLIKKLRILNHLMTGKQLLDMCSRAHLFQSDSPQPANKIEASCSAHF